jgi:hypothetical protein
MSFPHAPVTPLSPAATLYMSDPWGNLVYGKISAHSASLQLSTDVTFTASKGLSLTLKSVREEVISASHCEPDWRIAAVGVQCSDYRAIVEHHRT